MSKNGMAGGLSNRNYRVSLSYLPSPKTLHTIDFSRLDGGLNIYDLPYRLNPNESPDVRNLHWRDGALGCRAGQEWLINRESLTETGYTAAPDLFWDYAFVHVSNELRCFDPYADPASYTVLATGVPRNRGTFFRYGEYLMYKNRGGYYRIGYNVEGSTPAAMFPVDTESTNEFVPTTYINTNPTTIAGTVYQPENRLSHKKTIWYSAEDGVADYYVPYGGDSDVTNAIIRVEVDGVVLVDTVDYTVEINPSTKKAIVHFTTAPAVPDPFVPNTVKITYSSSGMDAYNSIMDCPYAILYGGDQNLCVVVGGCPAQPNAYFWSGNDQVSMNPFYFPMEHYNFAGDTESDVMGFGKQQGFLVVLSKKGVGRAKFGTVTTSSERLQIEMPYTAINGRLGCDYPWSIQLVENNIVYCNAEHGVCYVADSSAAYENNIQELSKKINGNNERHGLHYDIQTAGESGVFSTVHRDQYWIVANGNAYVWDYRLSNASNPSWFFYTNMRGVAFIRNTDSLDDDLFHMNSNGSITAMREGLFSDYGNAIFKTYQFAVQMMGTYDRLKDVVSVIFVVRSDTYTIADIDYLTDYENRRDLTPLGVMQWTLVPRNLAFRFLGVDNFATVFRRRPMCRHVRHFSMRLTNNEPGQDLSVVSAELFYNFQGRQM